MSLYRSPLMYVFFETYQLETERELFECSMGLPVLEIEPHLPHHRHGVVKYDAGNIILSLNWTSSDNFSADTSDGFLTVFDGNPGLDVPGPYPGVISTDGRGLVTDLHGHHFLFSSTTRGARDAAPPAVQELRLMVKDLSASIVFYRDILGMEMLEEKNTAARFAAGGVALVLEEKGTAPDGRRARHDTYLLVFYTPQIETVRRELIQRGLIFKGSHVGHSEIGATARFEDPSSHRICIYEPSQACLQWGSGRKVMEIMDRSACTSQLN
jgi:catechol 2,3-dioxygenase-like lactoylglutathione lyase family enzyme